MTFVEIGTASVIGSIGTVSISGGSAVVVGGLAGGVVGAGVTVAVMKFA